MKRILLALVLLSSLALCSSDVQITNVTFSNETGMYNEITSITVTSTQPAFGLGDTAVLPYNVTFYDRIGGNWSKIGQKGMGYNDASVTLEWVPGFAGTHQLRIVADETNVNNDSNMGDNERNVSFYVKAHDLDAKTFSVTPALGIVGETTTITLRVHKTGGTAPLFYFEGGAFAWGQGRQIISAPHDPYNVTFYDVKPDKTVEVIKSVRTGYQAPDSDMDFAVNWTPLMAGKHRIKASIDAINEYNESDEFNNNASLDYSVDPVESLLAVDCGSLKTDKYGFVDLAAYAGFYKGGMLYCYDTNVTAVIGSYSYDLTKYYNCRFSKAVQLPLGTYKAAFTAQYAGMTQKQKECTVTVESSIEPELIVYGLEQNASYAVNESVHVEAVATANGRNLMQGEAVAALMNGTDVVTGIFLDPDSRGVFKGDLGMDAPAGNYTLIVAYRYEFWYAQKDFAVIIGAGAGTPSKPAGTPGMRVTIIYPKQDATYTMNSTLPVQVKIEDLNGLLVSGANVTAEVWQEGEYVENITFNESKYYYEARYTFDKGLYLLNVSAYKAGIGAVSDVLVQFIAGQRPSEALENLTVLIITPKSDVYAENSTLVVRARVTNASEPVKNATVVMVFQGTETNMTYDKYGEYTTTAGPLPEGEYDLAVIATYGEDVAQDRVSFMTSKHRLDVRPVAPEYQQATEIKKGQSIPVSAAVTDETGDVVSGALVIAEILEPTGRALQMQVFQTPATGQYDTVFYPNDDGIYRITFRASKERFIGDSEDSEFTIRLKQENILPVKISFETLLTIALLLAIVILLAAILKIVF
jgi:hypothetical protein